jgi:plastocyanin
VRSVTDVPADRSKKFYSEGTNHLRNPLKTMKGTTCSVVLFWGLCLLFLNHSTSSLAAVTNVIVGPVVNGVESLSFSPSTVTIHVGDSVIWTWQSTFHSTTSTASPALWDSGLHNNPFSYTNKFLSAGSFGYICTFHGFTGTVIVQSANVPPNVALTNPINGATFSAPASFTLTATATDSDGSVVGVQFFNGTSSLENVGAPPYSIAVNNLAAGDYSFSAIATDNGGLTATNAIVIHVVTPSPIVLGSPQIITPNGFQFTYSANRGLSYVVLQSSNLTSWTALNTNMAASSTVTFLDTNAAAGPGFYRVGLLPNP